MDVNDFKTERSKLITNLEIEGRMIKQKTGAAASAFLKFLARGK